MQNASIERIKMTRRQSLQKFGNPYGDDANMLLIALNAAYKARKQLAFEYPGIMIPEIDDDLKDMIAYLKEHERARPWKFDQMNGYSYIDQSDNNWEGRWRNF